MSEIDNMRRNMDTVLRGEFDCLQKNQTLTMCLLELIVAHKTGDEAAFAIAVDKAKSASPLIHHVLETEKNNAIVKKMMEDNGITQP